MAKYNVTLKCGCKEVIELTGQESARQKKIEWYGDNKICDACFRKMREEEADAQTEKLSLIPLNGTSKQTAWAKVLRLSFLEKVERTCKQKDEYNTKLREIYLNKILSIDSAKWWIETRDIIPISISLWSLHKELDSDEFDKIKPEILKLSDSEIWEMIKACAKNTKRPFSAHLFDGVNL